ncbi:APC family permease [Rhodococcus erythropolis]|uniref:APC family permease n=1 Tax=Rhodococcus erythropolis TaxID=1833 RepID=UPI001BE66EA1|nr:APC family permease [Rhodococcus erythropolis]MBT2266049.1 APC family permease [Rhodococcus erythropolis]
MTEPIIAEDQVPIDREQASGEAIESSTLKRQMGTKSLMLVVLAYMSPITAVAGYVPLAIGYGNGLGAPLMFVAVGIVMLFFSVGFSAMVRNIPRPGAFYAYISAGLGRRVGLGAGYLAAANYIVGGASFFFFGGITVHGLMLSSFNIDVPWWAYALFFLVIVSVFSYRGMQFNVRILVPVVLVELALVAAFNIGTLIRGGPTGYATDVFTWEAFTSGPIAVAALFVLALFAGWETTAVYREEVHNPDRAIPRATYLLAAFVSLFYGLVAWCLIIALGTDKAVEATAADPAGSFSTAIAHSLGGASGQILTVLIITSIIACELSIANASSRYLYSFSVDKMIPHGFSKVHDRLGSPHRAAVLNIAIMVIAALVMFIVSRDPVEIYVAATGVLMFAFEALMLLMSIAVVVYFRRNRGTGEPLWKVVIAPIVSSCIFACLLYVSAINSDLILGERTTLVPVLFALVAVFFIVGFGYASFLANRRPADFHRIGRTE